MIVSLMPRPLGCIVSAHHLQMAAVRMVEPDVQFVSELELIRDYIVDEGQNVEENFEEELLAMDLEVSLCLMKFASILRS